MGLPGLVRPLAAAEPDTAELVLAPVTCRHVEMSHELIGRAALEVPPGRAIVLGAGACREIPLVALAQRFEAIHLVDLAGDELAAAVALLDTADDVRATVTTEVADLTGLSEQLVDNATSCLFVASSPDHAIELLVDAARGADAACAVPAGQWDLVVASCVPTQLHIAAVDKITSQFAAQFPNKLHLLEQSPAWTDAMMDLAWRLQDAFMSRLLELITPTGRVYLSATVQVCQTFRRLAGGLRVPGWYRMMQHRTLAANLPAGAAPLYGAEWPYVAARATLDAPGLLYHVHAVIMARGDSMPTSTA